MSKINESTGFRGSAAETEETHGKAASATCYLVLELLAVSAALSVKETDDSLFYASERRSVYASLTTPVLCVLRRETRFKLQDARSLPTPGFVYGRLNYTGYFAVVKSLRMSKIKKTFFR